MSASTRLLSRSMTSSAFRQNGQAGCSGPSRVPSDHRGRTTTRPLGQGCGASVGMAIAGRWLARRFNRSDLALFDYDVFTFAAMAT